MGKCEPAKSQVMSQSPNMLLLYWCAKRMRGGDADDGGSLLMRFGARVAPPALYLPRYWVLDDGRFCER